MFRSIALAQRIDAAEARLSESLGRAAMRAEPEGVAFVDAIGGGVAVYTGPASPMNKMIGAGFDDDTYRAARNHGASLLMTASEVNVEHLLKYQKIVITADALPVLAQRTAE